VKFPALLINHMGMIIMTKEIITSLHFFLKKLISSHPSACKQSSEEFASPECGSEFRLPEQRCLRQLRGRESYSSQDLGPAG